VVRSEQLAAQSRYTESHSVSLRVTLNIVCNNCAQCNCTHIWADLTVLWIGFCLTGPISLCVDSFLCMYCMHVWACNTLRWTWWDWSLSLGPLLPSVLYDTVGWVIWPVEPVPDMTYNVLSGTLNSTQWSIMNVTPPHHHRKWNPRLVGRPTRCTTTPSHPQYLTPRRSDRQSA